MGLPAGPSGSFNEIDLLETNDTLQMMRLVLQVDIRFLLKEAKEKNFTKWLE